MAVTSELYYSNPSGSVAWVRFQATDFSSSRSLHVIARRSGTSTWITQTLYSSAGGSTGYSTFTSVVGAVSTWYIKLSYGFISAYEFALSDPNTPTTPIANTNSTYVPPGGSIADGKVYQQAATDSFPYNGTARVSVSSLTSVLLGSSSDAMWRLVVNDVTKASFTAGGNKTIELSYLYDNDTSASYTVELWPPRASTYIATCTIPHQKNAAAETLVPPNITKLDITGVSASGFTVTAVQNNLTHGSWAIQISRYSSFSTIAAESDYKMTSITSITHEFSGLSANTLYYIRAVNYLNLEYAYSEGTWSRRTGIVPFDWAGTVEPGVVPSEVITKDKWDLLQTKISQVSVRNGSGSVSFAAVTQGAAITAAAFNDVRNELALLNNVGSVPGTKKKGDPMLAADFANGTASLKSAINRAISALNN